MTFSGLEWATGSSSEISLFFDLLITTPSAESLFPGFFENSDKSCDMIEDGNLDIASTGPHMFRLAQLLNTFWLSWVYPEAMTGAFDSTMKSESQMQSPVGIHQPTSTTADVETIHIVLQVQWPWAAILTATLLLLIAAGLTTAFLELNRHAPMVLDTSMSSLKQNSYAKFNRGNCTEDGADMARRLKYLQVQIGDVRPWGGVGHVAIATPWMVQEVKEIKEHRLYT
ncbi:hypothetical protein DOTSEDRAFT_22944 [Dothistroma septosporum NZE10]|uniref:Uncharacterized protein n=1 Tax=Dothistroma septosporum (strain NZE10 / CBS 128990) TaxID=675120 RepID=N1PU78_DOTSN|nr:hypothetical protein DOTSEDRAFT_22944 [Dothistroma septosporum NZE10]